MESGGDGMISDQTAPPAQKQPAYDVQQWDSEGFVGTRDRLSPDEFRLLIDQLAGKTASTDPSTSAAYFLKWAHEVSGLISQLPDQFPSPQGQLITPQLELRWQQSSLGYDVLLLSATSLDKAYGFQPISQSEAWETCLRPVLPHPRRVPQYPKAFKYDGLLAEQLCQRYFRNAYTGVVQFVALSLISPSVSQSNTSHLQEVSVYE